MNRSFPPPVPLRGSRSMTRPGRKKSKTPPARTNIRRKTKASRSAGKARSAAANRALFGGEAYASLPGDPLEGASEFTFEAWVYWNKEPSYGEPVFDFGSSSTNHMYLTPGKKSGGEKKLTFEIRTAGNASALVMASKLATGAWSYVAVSETSTGTLTLYVDGKEVGQTTSATVTPASLGSGLDSDYLGKSLADEPELKGRLSNVAFYKKALTAGEIAGHYSAGEFPVNTDAPSVSGTAKEGKKLKAKAGTWTGVAPITYEYQWQHCYQSECESATGTGAKEKEYTVAAGDVGYKLRVLVTAKNSAGTREAASAETETITGTGLAPKNTEVPKVEGEAVEGRTLTANHGKWEGTPPLSYAYQWELCNSFGEACLPIIGEAAKAPEYELGRSEVGTTLRVRVTAENSVGAAEATSAAGTEVSVQPGSAAVAWGRNYPVGQLGAGYEDDYEVAPVSVVGLSDIRSIVAAGRGDSYALLGDGTAVAWGENSKRRGQLGDGSTEPSRSPVPIVERTEGGEWRTMTGVTAVAAAWSAGFTAWPSSTTVNATAKS